MFAVKYYDLGMESEFVGYYPDALKKEMDYQVIGNPNKMELFQEEEYKRKDNLERAVRRAKTKIRRCAEKYNLQYMWTFTFAKKITKIHNPKNKKNFTYDAGDWSDAWKCFNIFIRRCQKAGLKFNYIVTAEVQEKRLEKYGEKVFHFHMCTDKWIPQNDVMMKKANRNRAYKDWYHNHFQDFWTFGFCKATEKKGQKLCVNYMVKYISKAFEEVDVKGKQRYHISEGMDIPFELLKFNSHEEYLYWIETQQNLKKDKFGNPVTKYFILGSSLEIWWHKIINL